MERKNLCHIAEDKGNNYNHFAGLLGLGKWVKYRTSVYWFLYRLETNTPFCIDMKVPEEEIAMFITTACDFIKDIAFKKKCNKDFLQGEWWEFNEDCNEITHKKI